MFTEEQEKVLKLIAEEFIAKHKLNTANIVMGNEIRAACKAIDTKIRKEHKETYEPLQIDLAAKRQTIKDEFNNPGVRL